MVRKWSLSGWRYMVVTASRTYWWQLFPSNWTRFDTVAEAKKAYANRHWVANPEIKERKHFISWL